MAKATPYRLLFLVWIAFVTRGLFYCVQQPMWEGYDEWAHFAYIQHVAARQNFGHGRTAVVIVILPSVMAEFMIDVCRVGNECLAVVLVSALILSALRLVSREAGWRAWALFGALLGAGLLTKAYVLA